MQALDLAGHFTTPATVGMAGSVEAAGRVGGVAVTVAEILAEGAGARGLITTPAPGHFPWTKETTSASAQARHLLL